MENRKMVRLIILTLLCLSCSPKGDDTPSNCQTYKISLPLDLNSASYCYGLAETPELVCSFESGTYLCHSRGRYHYKVVWNYKYTGEVYEFIDNKSVLTGYVSLEADQFVYRRVDDNTVIRACNIQGNTLQLCGE